MNLPWCHAYVHRRGVTTAARCSSMPGTYITSLPSTDHSLPAGNLQSESYCHGRMKPWPAQRTFSTHASPAAAVNTPHVHACASCRVPQTDPRPFHLFTFPHAHLPLQPPTLAPPQTFVASLWLPLLLGCYCLGPLAATARPCWDPRVLIPQLWLLAVYHDFHFWAVHAVMHGWGQSGWEGRGGGGASTYL
jgi:hypothetical protein